MKVICYDVEVQKNPMDMPHGFNKPFDLGLSTAVAYDWEDDHYHFFMGETGRIKLIELLNRSDVVVGYNHLQFDNLVVYGNDGRIPSDLTDQQPVDFDLLAFLRTLRPEIYRYEPGLKLGEVCGKTILKGKRGEGSHAPELWRQGRIDELFEYNLSDVRLTWELFVHFMAEGFVIDGTGKALLLPKDFGNHCSRLKELQEGLCDEFRK